jgi:hypothetical protein
MNLKEDNHMYFDYDEFMTSCQAHLEESQQLWEKEMERWQQINQNYVNGFAYQIEPAFQGEWYTQTFKDLYAIWEKGWLNFTPWIQYSFWPIGDESQHSYEELSEELDQLNEFQSGQKKKNTELTRQLTLMKKDMAAQKQLSKSQAIELEALKDNLGLQEKTLSTLESRLKAIEKQKSVK